LEDRPNIDWRREYRVTSFYNHKIRNNRLVVTSKGGKNPYNFVVYNCVVNNILGK